jgi:hypothetical protein
VASVVAMPVIKRGGGPSALEISAWPSAAGAWALASPQDSLMWIL